MTVLLFLDIETTGVDPEKDQILEVYCQPCYADTLDEIVPPFHACVLADMDLLLGMEPFVRNMHIDSGLLHEVGQDLDLVVRSLSEYLRAFPKGVLVGRNVGTFDRRFLEAAGVDLSGLHYHNLDVSTVLRVLRTWPSLEGPGIRLPKMKGTKHRAGDDVKHDIETMRVIADYLESVE